MKPGSKKGWRSVMPLASRDILRTHFCMFPKVKSTSHDAGSSPVYLNVYDLTPVNGYFYWAGLGIFHTGVEGQLTIFSIFIHLDHEPLNVFDTWDINKIIAVSTQKYVRYHEIFWSSVWKERAPIPLNKEMDWEKLSTRLPRFACKISESKLLKPAFPCKPLLWRWEVPQKRKRKERHSIDGLKAQWQSLDDSNCTKYVALLTCLFTKFLFNKAGRLEEGPHFGKS